MTTGGKRRGGFTLLEMLVSIAILAILMSIIFEIIQMTSQAWKQSSQGTSTMQQTRVAFERLTRNLSEATLNTYYSYLPVPPAQPQFYYMRPVGTPGFISRIWTGGRKPHHLYHLSRSERRASHSCGFLSGDHRQRLLQQRNLVWGNLGNLLNACGYFVSYGPDPSRPSIFNAGGTLVAHAPPSENRFRLMEYLQPSEYLSAYTGRRRSPAYWPPPMPFVPAWITNGMPANLTTSWSSLTPPITVHSLANNIVALIIMPE